MERRKEPDTVTIPPLGQREDAQIRRRQGPRHALNKATGVKLICVNPTESDVQVANAMKGAPASFKVPALGVVIF